MAKAAAQLRITQPAVSKAIGDLEATLGVRLFDRSPRGFLPTKYGTALLRCGTAVFDELRQGVKNIEYLSDPTLGELLIGCPEAISSSILPPIVDIFSQRHPRVFLDVDTGGGDVLVRRLVERNLDLFLAPMGRRLSIERFDDELHIETLFNDELIIAAGGANPWARRRKIDLSELVNERWIMTGRDDWSQLIVAEAFQRRGLKAPNIILRTLSVHLRANLLATGRFIAAMPRSVLRLYGDRFGLKELPIDLPPSPWPFALVTLKNRTLSPVAERFIECAREVAGSFESRNRPIKKVR